MDVNDNSPVFSKSSYSVEVSEDAAEGYRVLEVKVIGHRRSGIFFIHPNYFLVFIILWIMKLYLCLGVRCRCR